MSEWLEAGELADMRIDELRDLLKRSESALVTLERNAVFMPSWGCPVCEKWYGPDHSEGCELAALLAVLRKELER